MIDRSSLRPPSGFIFNKGAQTLRAIDYSYKEDFDHLMNSGLYDSLVNKKLLIRHNEVSIADYGYNNIYKLIKPEAVKFVSYPHEWSFSQLKDAALAALKIQDIALDYDMSLKYCSAYNMQFHNGKPMLIDSLSFEKYEKGKTWAAYKQFCQHFLAPLALMGYKDYKLNQLLKNSIDGIPLDLANSLLPSSIKLNNGVMRHISIHSKLQKEFFDNEADYPRKDNEFSLSSLKSLIWDLGNTVQSINLTVIGTEWKSFYETNGYCKEYTEHKKSLVYSFITKVYPSEVWDLGTNNGPFSRLASDKGVNTVAFDIDAIAVERNYLEARSKKETTILPLFMDLKDPGLRIGWSNNEMKGLANRGQADLVIALALIHHLVISNNYPFYRIAEFLVRICKWLVIEFIPKEDEEVITLLKKRKDMFPDYNQQSFEQQFTYNFTIENSVTIRNSNRILYLMKRKD